MSAHFLGGGREAKRFRLRQMAPFRERAPEKRGKVPALAGRNPTEGVFA